MFMNIFYRQYVRRSSSRQKTSIDEIFISLHEFFIHRVYIDFVEMRDKRSEKIKMNQDFLILRSNWLIFLWIHLWRFKILQTIISLTNTSYISKRNQHISFKYLMRCRLMYSSKCVFISSINIRDRFMIVEEAIITSCRAKFRFILSICCVVTLVEIAIYLFDFWFRIKISISFRCFEVSGDDMMKKRRNLQHKIKTQHQIIRLEVIYRISERSK